MTSPNNIKIRVEIEIPQPSYGRPLGNEGADGPLGIAADGNVQWPLNSGNAKAKLVNGRYTICAFGTATSEVRYVFAKVLDPGQPIPEVPDEGTVWVRRQTTGNWRFGSLEVPSLGNGRVLAIWLDDGAAYKKLSLVTFNAVEGSGQTDCDSSSSSGSSGVALAQSKRTANYWEGW